MLGGFPLSGVFHQERSPGPAYVYDLDGIEAGARDLAAALGPSGLVAYAMKANSAGSIVRRLAAAGIGADVVSGAELELACRCGVPVSKIVMSGVAKSDTELDLAISRGIRALQIESVEELRRVDARARTLGVRARVSVRLNPSVAIQSKLTSAQRWLMLDAGMNDLIRPALYGARHRIEPMAHAPSGTSWHVVGPVCESSDDFGHHELGPDAPRAVVIRDAGAYGFTLASEYNGRPLPAEFFLSGGRISTTSSSPGADAWIERRFQA